MAPADRGAGRGAAASVGGHPAGARAAVGAGAGVRG